MSLIAERELPIRTRGETDWHGLSVSVDSAEGAQQKPASEDAMASDNQSQAVRQTVDGELIHWARPVRELRVSDVPQGAINLNVDGSVVVSPLQGFGALWQKTYRVHLNGLAISPAAVMQTWKEHFPEFQPAENRFFPPLSGIEPGAVVLINGKVPPAPGLPSLLPVAGGVLVLYADETSFTVMTHEGFPEAGWNTFSTYEENGHTVAQVQTLARAADPIYEFWFRFLGSSAQQDKTWTHVLTALANYVGGREVHLETHKVLLDPTLQWSQAKAIWRNAGVRTMLYLLGEPVRWAERSVRAELAKRMG
ncbi:MAG TPA: hypothetical protein PKE45_04680 [Caldilineaceae bacterium]|nr:hypothetical protein [Caldilineaceae bacterium]